MNKLRAAVAAAWNTGREWLTDARRQAVHAALGTIASVAVTIGWVDDGTSAAVLAVAGSALALAQGVFGLSLLTRSDRARWLGTAGRGLIYAFAASAGAAGVVTGIWADGEVQHALALVTGGLTVISAFLAVVNVQTAPTLPDGALQSRRAYRQALASKEN